MILSKKKDKPNKIKLGLFDVEVVDEFKLLGIIIDNQLNFIKYVEYLKKTINQKLFAIKNIFLNTTH